MVFKGLSVGIQNLGNADQVIPRPPPNDALVLNEPIQPPPDLARDGVNSGKGMLLF